MSKGWETFKSDLKAGQRIEQEVLLLIQNKYPDSFMEEGYFKEWDIYVPELDIGVEVKSDQKSQHTGNIVIEFEFDGKPSALATTKATYWVIYDGLEYRWFLPSEIIRCIKENDLRYVTFTGRGDTKSKKAYLIKKELLYKYSHESNNYKPEVPAII